MTRNHIVNFIALAGMSALADTSYAGQPPCATSDGSEGTACGSNALAENTGLFNSAFGYNALSSNTSGASNTASGANALRNNSSGLSNTASGTESLTSNTGGSYNTANGDGALSNNTMGNRNTASGISSLFANTTGSYNTASGAYALSLNQSGSNITAVGYKALYHSITTAAGNMTAVGSYALYNNSTGTGNNAQGYQAMYRNTTGSNNAAIGAGALYSNTTGFGNEGIGLTALENMTTGNRNTAVGNNAGLNLAAGSYNTYIGWGANGSSSVIVAEENYVTRIGVTYNDPAIQPFNPTTYISGIANSHINGVPVYVTSTGQLGVLASAERYKTDIAPLGADTEKLSALRPVRFHLKTEPAGAIQYGLIAEEVDKVYPELVIRDDGGRIQGVRYDELAPMLLSQAQKQQQHAAAQDATIVAQNQRIESLERELAEMHAALAALQSKD
jgi:hypothetical protein